MQNNPMIAIDRSRGNCYLDRYYIVQTEDTQDEEGNRGLKTNTIGEQEGYKSYAQCEIAFRKMFGDYEGKIEVTAA